MNKKIAFKTLGCRLNQFETDALVSKFDKNRYRVVDFESSADAYIINTCTVTNQADKKSRQEINKALRKQNGSMVIVTGCMVNNHRHTFDQQSENVYYIENKQKSSIFNLIDAHYSGETFNPVQSKFDPFSYEPAAKTLHTRAMIKIQDGCDNFCTFCIIPKVRGRAQSRPVNDILNNIKEVIGFGFKEIVLTGVNIGRYEYDGFNFESLVESILNIPGDFRVRISSIEPDGFGDKFIELFKHPKLMPHLHLCLQSGSNKVLLKMRRMYTVQSFLRLTEKIQSSYPEFNLTTDLIVGFPGETENDFQQSISLIEKIGFSHVHTFKYSIRNGTRAAIMPDQIPEKTKSQRSRIIQNLSSKNKHNYYNSLVGTEQIVLVEKNNNGTASGYGEYYAPVRFKTRKTNTNQFVSVKITGLENRRNPILTAVELK